jgi:hypothetical protein
MHRSRQNPVGICFPLANRLYKVGLILKLSSSSGIIISGFSFLKLWPSFFFSFSWPSFWFCSLFECSDWKQEGMVPLVYQNKPTTTCYGEDHPLIFFGVFFLPFRGISPCHLAGFFQNACN